MDEKEQDKCAICWNYLSNEIIKDVDRIKCSKCNSILCVKCHHKVKGGKLYYKCQYGHDMITAFSYKEFLFNILELIASVTVMFFLIVLPSFISSGAKLY